MKCANSNFMCAICHEILFMMELSVSTQKVHGVRTKAALLVIEFTIEHALISLVQAFYRYLKGLNLYAALIGLVFEGKSIMNIKIAKTKLSEWKFNEIPFISFVCVSIGKVIKLHKGKSVKITDASIYYSDGVDIVVRKVCAISWRP